MIKGLLLASGMSGVYLLLITLLFRRFRVQARAAVMTRLFLATLPFFAALHWLTPPNLGFLPESLAEPNRWIDLGFASLLYGAAFFGGILQLYNLADRGFSLRIVMDIDEAQERALSLEQVLTGYSAGKGIGWMYQKRLDDLVANRFGRIEDGWLRNRKKGRRVAHLFGKLRQFLRIEG